MSYSGNVGSYSEHAVQSDVVGQLSVEELFNEQIVEDARDEVSAVAQDAQHATTLMHRSDAQHVRSDQGTNDTTIAVDVPTLADVPTGRHGSAARLRPTDEDDAAPSSRRSRRSSPDSSQVGNSRTPSRGLIEPVETLPQIPLRRDLSPGATLPLKPSARERAKGINLRTKGVRSHSSSIS